MRLGSTLTCVIVVLSFAPAAPAQTPAEVSRRIGARPATETFQIEPWLTVAVAYDRAGQVCEANVEWRQAPGVRLGGFMEVHRLAEKLAPRAERGRSLGGPVRRIPVLNCCEGWTYPYEKVRVTNFLDGNYHGVKISFRERQCDAKLPDVIPAWLRRWSEDGKPLTPEPGAPPPE